MSALLYLVVIAGLGLVVYKFLMSRATPQGFHEESCGEVEGAAVPTPWDPLTSELSAKIFDPRDSEFIRDECSQQLARRFRMERTALALDWLREVRRQVNLLMRGHLRSARLDSDLKPADELKLGCEFLLFQVTSGFLYFVISVFGPLHAARLVGYPLVLAKQLREMTAEILPSGAQVAAELLDVEPKVSDRTAAR